MKINRFHEGHTRIVLPAATLPPCTCAAFKADLNAGAYAVEIYQFEFRGRVSFRARVYTEVLLGHAAGDGPMVCVCPHCGGELGETDRFFRVMFPNGWDPEKRPSPRQSLA